MPPDEDDILERSVLSKPVERLPLELLPREFPDDFPPKLNRWACVEGTPIVEKVTRAARTNTLRVVVFIARLLVRACCLESDGEYAARILSKRSGLSRVTRIPAIWVEIRFSVSLESVNDLEMHARHWLLSDGEFPEPA